METVIIILAVALAVFVLMFILSEIEHRKLTDEWAKEVVENCKLKDKLKKYEQEDK